MVKRFPLLVLMFLVSTMLHTAFADPKPPISIDKVKFVSVPPQNGQVNVNFDYTAKAVSSDSTAVIRYSTNIRLAGVMPMEAGYKIDSITGLVTWKPMLKGWYEIDLFAKSSKGGMAKQEFVVAVAG